MIHRRQNSGLGFLDEIVTSLVLHQMGLSGLDGYAFRGVEYEPGYPPTCSPSDGECVTFTRALHNIAYIIGRNRERASSFERCKSNARLNGRPNDPLCDQHAPLPLPTLEQCVADRSGQIITGTGEPYLTAVARIRAEAIARHEAMYPQFTQAVQLAVTGRSNEIDAAAVAAERIAQATPQTTNTTRTASPTSTSQDSASSGQSAAATTDASQAAASTSTPATPSTPGGSAPASSNPTPRVSENPLAQVAAKIQDQPLLALAAVAALILVVKS